MKETEVFTSLKELPIPFEESSFILSRLCSGILNGGFYADLPWLGAIGAILTIFFTIFSIIRNKRNKRKGYYKKFKKEKWNRFEQIIFTLGFIAAIACIVMVVISFGSPTLIFADVHLWTFLTQFFQVGCMFLNNPKKWWRLLLLVTPAVFFQKLFINILGGNPWYYRGTNVSTGQYYTMAGLKIPRLFNGNMAVRLVFTIISLLVLWLSNREPQKIKNKK